MTDNIRWLIALSAASVTIYTVVAGLRLRRAMAVRRPAGSRENLAPGQHADAQSRRHTIVAVAGLLVFWSTAQIPPFGPWGLTGASGLRAAMREAESPRVLLACLVYLAIVITSSRGLIGMPLYRQLQARASELKQLAEGRSFAADRDRLVQAIDRAEQTGARRIGGFVVQVPLTDVLGANRTLNAIEKQMLSDLDGSGLRLAASQIAALMPASTQGTAAAEAIARAAAQLPDGRRDGHAVSAAEITVRNSCATALILLHRLRDVPQEREVNHIRVSIWLTVVGLAAAYALSVTWPGHQEVMIAGALGGLLGSLSALLTNRELSLGMVVLSPVAGALNALGGSIVIGFLAQEQIQVLGAVFRGVWSETGPVSMTALAAAVLLGFSGGLFSRIAVAGTAPLLGGETKTDAPPSAALVPARDAASEEGSAASATTAGHSRSDQSPDGQSRDGQSAGHSSGGDSPGGQSRDGGKQPATDRSPTNGHRTAEPARRGQRRS